MRVKGTPNVRRRPITRGALVGRRPDGGSSHGWAVPWIPASAGMTDRWSLPGLKSRQGVWWLRITLRITSSLRMQAVSRRTRESGKRPLLMSGLQGARCWRRTVTIDSEVRTLDHLNDVRHSHPVRHSCAPSITPAPPPSFLRPLRHSCVPSVIPAEAGIQAICGGQGHSQCSTAPDHPRWGLWWAVGRMEARRTVGRSHGFLPPQE